MDTMKPIRDERKPISESSIRFPVRKVYAEKKAEACDVCVSMTLLLGVVTSHQMPRIYTSAFLL